LFSINKKPTIYPHVRQPRNIEVYLPGFKLSFFFQNCQKKSRKLLIIPSEPAGESLLSSGASDGISSVVTLRDNAYIS